MRSNFYKTGESLFSPRNQNNVIKLGAAILAGALTMSACTDPTSLEPIPVDVTTHVEEELTLQTSDKLLTLEGRLDDDFAPTVNDRRATKKGGPDRGRFNITLKFITPVTDRQLQVFDEAAGRWERIIIGDVPSITGTIPSAFVGLPPVAHNETIDDIIIEVAIAAIDGPGQILGQAGPTFIRDVDNLPVSGVMFFDVDDLALLDEYELFDDVIVHEMGHVLGVGTLWNVNRTLREFNPQGAPFFNGKLANLLWWFEGGRNLLPIEDQGGPGTALSHWKESILDNELMTGYINLGINPLSRITSASVRDLGYLAIPTGEKYDLPRNTPGVENYRINTGGVDIENGEILLAPIGVIVTK
ncbi:hypothetical protein GCM10009119_16320 [Algoriphagus jejuensis]|uniref:Leishmanolysin n=1 Tax=Algoriphagus jejuensis TaxID=419934 RepID=A0ABP3YE70_9BACT